MAKQVKETVPLPDAVEQELESGSSADASTTEAQAVALRSTLGTIQDKQAQALQSFMEWLAAKANTTDEDQYAIMASIVAEIRAADSPAEVLRERSALHARDILNRPLVLHGFEIREGDYEESDFNFYAAMTMGSAGSEITRVVTCGATKVLAKLWRLEEFGEWPLVVWFTAKGTSKGYTTIDICTPNP